MKGASRTFKKMHSEAKSLWNQRSFFAPLGQEGLIDQILDQRYRISEPADHSGQLRYDIIAVSQGINLSGKH